MGIYDPSTEPDDAMEQAIYADAWRIADPGAVNPVAVASTLRNASSALIGRLGTDGVRRHPALRVMAGQLAMLYNVDAIGASAGDYEAVRVYYVHQMTAEQEAALSALCERYCVPFRKSDYRRQADLPAGYVAGWAGGQDDQREHPTIYVGCSPEGVISS